MNSTIGKIILGAVGVIIVIWLLSIILKPKPISESGPLVSPVPATPTPAPDGSVQGETTSEEQLAWPAEIDTTWKRSFVTGQQLVIYYPPEVQESQLTSDMVELNVTGASHQPENDRFDFLTINVQAKELESDTLKGQAIKSRQEITKQEIVAENEVEAVVVSGLSGYAFTIEEGAITRQYYILPKELFITGNAGYVILESAWADPNARGYETLKKNIIETLDLYPDKRS